MHYVFGGKSWDSTRKQILDKREGLCEKLYGEK